MKERVFSALEYGSALVEPAQDANKYSRGTLLVVAGSASYPGAAILASSAATRSGAGYVTLATAESVVGVALAHLLIVRVVGLPSTPQGSISPDALETIEAHIKENDALLIGPGLTRSEQTAQVVREVVATATIPTVLDADGLNAFEGHLDELHDADQPCILTPHAGELARLGSLEQVARPGCIVVAKGPTTVITDGVQAVIDTTGPPSLATPGTGDVLAGIISALLCQGRDPFTSAVVGVRLHATAGRCATEAQGAISMIASDVIDYIGEAIAGMKEDENHA